VAELKASESYVCSNLELEPNKGNDRGKKIIDSKPNATMAIAKMQKNEPEDLEEGSMFSTHKCRGSVHRCNSLLTVGAKRTSVQ